MKETELLEIAAELSRGSDVDWTDVESRATTDETRRVVRNLRLLQRIDGIDDEASSRWGHLELRKQIGGGSFGEVWEAYDPTLDTTVALKLLRDGRYVEEGRMLARIRHPNVAVVHGAAVHDGRAGLWMELVRGDALNVLINERGPFGAEEAALTGASVCRALSAMHAEGLIHRDVKAQNVMRERGGRTLLMDFGGALDLSDTETTVEISTAGTPLYMAPELFAGAPPGVASDVYSTGVLLYNLVTGSFPVSARSLVDLAKLHAAGEARLLRDVRSDLPESFQRVVERAIDPDPTRRFATAGEMERALSGVAAGTQSLPPATTTSERPGWSRVAVGFAAAIIVLAGALALTTPWKVTSNETPGTTQATMFRIDENGTRSPIASGDRVRVGDGLEMTFSSEVPVHLYVFSQDDRGNAYALFPLDSSDLRNPLPPSRIYTIPGRRPWQVDSSGGRERLVVVATVDRLDEFEVEMSRLPQAGSGAARVSPSGAGALTRGIGGLMDLPDAAAGNLWNLAERIERNSTAESDVWVHTFTFENP